MLRVRSVYVSLLSCCSQFANNGMRTELRRIETERFAMSPARRLETERFAKLPSRSHYQYSCIRFQAASISARVCLTSVTVFGWKASTVAMVSSRVNSWCFLEGL